MSLTFREVFPDIQIDESIRGLLDQSVVSRVTMNESQSIMTVYLECDRLIHREIFDHVEELIRSQLFSGQAVSVRIVEKFRLSGQYSARTLMPLYRDSIFYEVKKYDRILYSILHSASMDFTDDDSLKLTIPEGSITDSVSRELTQILEKI